MPKKRLPDLPDTGRYYLDDTMRARLATPGVLRYDRPRRTGVRVALAIAVLAALVAAMLSLAR
jgi:hypothetical protein